MKFKDLYIKQADLVLTIMGVMLMMGVLGAVVLNAIYLLSIQNEGMLNNITSVSDGG